MEANMKTGDIAGAAVLAATALVAFLPACGGSDAPSADGREPAWQVVLELEHLGNEQAAADAAAQQRGAPGEDEPVQHLVRAAPGANAGEAERVAAALRERGFTRARSLHQGDVLSRRSMLE
jgi:hypothetical protein